MTLGEITSIATPTTRPYVMQKGPRLVCDGVRVQQRYMKYLDTGEKVAAPVWPKRRRTFAEKVDRLLFLIGY